MPREVRKNAIYAKHLRFQPQVSTLTASWGSPTAEIFPFALAKFCVWQFVLETRDFFEESGGRKSLQGNPICMWYSAQPPKGLLEVTKCETSYDESSVLCGGSQDASLPLWDIQSKRVFTSVICIHRWPKRAVQEKSRPKISKAFSQQWVKFRRREFFMPKSSIDRLYLR